MSGLDAARCPSCEAPRVPGGQYCHRCGTPLDAIQTRIAERRVVTVLFGDLSDFTAWAEDLDPERVGSVIDRVLAALTAAVAEFGGHVDKLTGDGIMGVFGAPVAHEDDALRAVRAAAAMQEAVGGLVRDETGGGTQLGLRVGLNTGEVLAGVQAALSYTVVGDTVNTASRLSDVGQVGAVVAGRETAQATMAEVSWRPLPPLRLKGKREDVTAYELVGLRTTVGGVAPGVGDEAPFLGREDELGECVRTVMWSVQNSSPSSILVLGEAGLGKKRLAHELGRFVGELPGARVLWGRCWPYGEGRDLGPLLEVVRTALGVVPGRPVSEQVNAVRRGVARLGPGGAPGTELADDLLAMLGLAPGTTAAGAAKDALSGSYLDAVARLLGLLAMDGPVLVVIDGIQWATESMRDLLTQAGARLDGPLVMMGLGRPELLTGFRDVVWERLPERHLIELQPLDLATSDRLLLSHLGAELDAPARAALLDRAEGNPFFLAEVLHLLVDRGVLHRGDDGRWTLSGLIGEDVLPAGVQAVLAARVDELDPDTKIVLRDASVAGVRFDAETLVAMQRSTRSGMDAEAVEAALDTLCTGGYVRADRMRGGVGHRGYVFTHAMARDVAYAGVPKADRARRHAAVARWADEQRGQAQATPLAPWTIPQDGPGDPGPQPDLDALVAWQGRRALELAREMRLPVSDPVYRVRDLTVRALLRTARDADRENPQVLVDQLSDALDLATDPAYGSPWEPGLLGRSRVALAAALAGTGDTARAEEILLAEASDDDPQVQAEATAALASLRRRQGRDVDAGRLGEEALDLAQRSGLRPLASQLQRSLGLAAYLGGRLREAGDRFRAVLDDSRTRDDLRGEAWALQQLAWTATTQGDYAAAEQWLALAAESFAGLEDSVGLSWCAGTEGLVRLLQGRYRKALELAEGLLPLGDAIGDRWGTAACRVIVAYASASLGDTATGRAAAAQARRTFDELGDPWGRALAALATSAVEREDGQAQAALAAAEEGVRAATASGSSLVLLLATTQVGTCLLELDRGDEAEAAAGRALEIADEASLQPHAAVAALVVQAQVAYRPVDGGAAGTGAPADPERACRLLAEAERRSADQPPMLFSRRAVLAWYARALAATGHPVDASRYLAQAMRLSGTDRRARVLSYVVAAELARATGDDAGALTAALSARDAAGSGATPLTERELAPVLDLLRQSDTRTVAPRPGTRPR